MAAAAGDDGGGDIHSSGRVISWQPVTIELATGTSGAMEVLVPAMHLSDNDATSPL